MPIRSLAVLCLLSSSRALAQADGGTPAFTGELHASYRLLTSEQSDISLGQRDTGAPMEQLGHRWFVEHQLRLGGVVTHGNLELVAEANLLSGLFSTGAGDAIVPTPVIPEGGAPQPLVADPQRNLAWGVNPSSVAIRQLMLRWKTKYGVLAGGATTFNFGMGLLANDAGSMADPGFDRSLGDQRFGDRVVRASFTTRPGELFGVTEGPASKLIVALAADLVLEDSTATLVHPFSHWGQGVFADRAVQGLLALVWQEKTGQVGLIVTRRSIFFADVAPLDPLITQPFGTDLSAWAFDLAADVHVNLTSTLQLTGAFEGALVTGSTNHVRNDACPGVTDSQRCGVLQGGAVARGGLRWGRVSAELLGGFASGDSNPFDSNVNNFKIARDFQAGFILFDQVLAWQSAAQVRRASDPLLTNRPPAGVELLSTNGAITNALFLQPAVKVQLHPDVDVVASLLWARAAAPYTDALWTSRTARLTNAFGQPAGSGYGIELDAGANWRHTFGRYTVHAGLAAGVLLPGDAFVIDSTGKTMAPVHRVKLRLGVWF